jgi:hypothetical protein
MQYTVFKPNPKNTGGLVNLRIATTKNNKKDVWEKVLFAEFLPQKGWNDATKSGSFDASKKRSIAINVGEAGEMLYSVKRNVPFQNYHKSGDRSCWVKFIPYSRKREVGKEGDKTHWVGEVDNYAFGYSEKGVSVNIPLTSGEAEVFCLMLESYIKESMALDAKESDKKFKSKGKDSPKDEEPETEQEEEDSNDNVEDDDSSDIPF